MSRIYSLLILTFALSFNTYGQSPPKIGLVLSGGGAKGMAHIGVLKVLEEVGIIPDYITGTSMGAVVGGLYACGYSAAQLEEIALTADWDVLLANQTALSNIAIEHKPFYGRYQVSLPINGFKIGLPKGMIEGQELSEYLTRLTAPVHHINNFDNLPIPFRCIGADIGTGEKVVLKDGFLATAMRASMAIPTIFTPVEIDGKILVDGGLVHNFPVEDVIEMGADIVIGVSVGDSMLAGQELNSFMEILSQVTFFTSFKNTAEQIKYTDYYIHPDCPPYSTGSFAFGDSLVLRGERAARLQYDVLKSLADSLKQLRTFTPAELPPLDSSLVISSIEVEGNESFSDALIIGKLNIEPGSSLSADDIKQRIDAIYGMLNFDHVRYEIMPNQEGKTLKVIVKETTPGRASFNLHYDTENGIGFLTNLTFRNLGLNNTRLTIEGDIAETPYFLADYFLYIGKNQNHGISLGAEYFADDIPTFDFSGNKEVIYKSKLWQYYFNIQSTKYQNRTLGLRAFSNTNTIKPTVGDSIERPFNKLRYVNFGLKPYFLFNTLDRKSLPRKGLKASISATMNFYMNGELTDPLADLKDYNPDYTLLSFDAHYEQYFPVHKKFTLWMSHTIRLTNLESGKLNISDYHYAGGFRPNFPNSGNYWGADKYEFQLSSFYQAVGGLRYEPFKNLFINGAVNFLETEFPMAWFGDDFFEQALAGDRERRLSWLFSATLNTRVGPISFGVAKDVNRKKLKTYFSIGFNFQNYEG